MFLSFWSTESVLSTEAEESSDHIQSVVREVASLGLPCYVAALEQVMASEHQPPVLVPEVGQANYNYKQLV